MIVNHPDLGLLKLHQFEQVEVEAIRRKLEKLKAEVVAVEADLADALRQEEV